MSHVRLARLAVCLAAAAPAIAAANCYSIYDGKNQLAFQSTVAPVDLSMRIADAMRSRFPGGYLVMIPDDSDCRDFRTGGNLAPRFSAGLSGTQGGQNAGEILQASPLMRGTATTSSSGVTTGDLATSRESVRTGGNALNVRRSGRPSP